MKTVHAYREAVESVPELYILGEPDASLFSFGSNDVSSFFYLFPFSHFSLSLSYFLFLEQE